MSDLDNVSSMSLAISVAIFILLITFALFQSRDLISSFVSFRLILWIGLPVITFLFVSIVNLISQFISCGSIQAGKAFLGGLPSVGTLLAGLGIASWSYARLPVASVFAPFYAGDTLDIVTQKTKNTNASLNRNHSGKRCCTPQITLEQIESQYPILQGYSYGFYVLFSILFGFVFGNSIATVC